MNMKTLKTAIVCTVLAAFSAASLLAGDMKEGAMMHDGAMMKDGKMMMMKDGKTMEIIHLHRLDPPLRLGARRVDPAFLRFAIHTARLHAHDIIAVERIDRLAPGLFADQLHHLLAHFACSHTNRFAQTVRPSNAEAFSFLPLTDKH